VTANDWTPVSAALLFSWPSQVNSWGDAVLAGYCSQLERRGLTPEQAEQAILSCGAEHEHPPSAPVLAALARNDPSAPTFDELLQALYAPSRGVVAALWAYTESAGPDIANRRLAEQHETIRGFARSVGGGWLRTLDPLGPGEYAGADRRKLEHAWREFLERGDERNVASIVARRAGKLHSVDPARQIGDAS
jgi:hypothetical protein